MEHGSRTRLLSAIVIAAVFGAGILVGFAADSNWRAEAAEVVPAPAGDSADAPRRPPMYSQVNPTAEQQSRIDSIIHVHRKRTNALDETFREGFSEILFDTREAIKGVLTPEQAADYQRLLDERDAERERERRGN